MNLWNNPALSLESRLAIANNEIERLTAKDGGYGQSVDELLKGKTMKIKVKKLHKSATIPKYATKGSACFDLCAICEGDVNSGMSRIFRTGLSFEIPEGHVMLIYGRSGHGFTNNVRLSNCVGVIDSDYRGEVMIKMRNDSDDGSALTVNTGDRIAQAMAIPVQTIELIEVVELSETDRGVGGFGSTGAR